LPSLRRANRSWAGVNGGTVAVVAPPAVAAIDGGGGGIAASVLETSIMGDSYTRGLRRSIDWRLVMIYRT